MRSAVCLIVKNEAENIAEWVAHHSLIGFDEVIVYDNISDDGTTEILGDLAKHYNVSVRPWTDAEALRSTCKQMAAYEHCLASDGSRFDWLAYLDADEFLIPPQGGSMRTLFEQHRDADGIAVNWRIFGSSMLESSSGRLVMEAFTRRAEYTHNTNRHVKMLFRPRAAVRVVNPHYVETERPAVGVDGTLMGWSEPGITEPNRIVAGHWKLNHYIIRSRRHWERRMQRRQTDGMTRNWDEFELYDRNEFLDVSALSCANTVARNLAGHGFAYAPVPVLEEEPAPAAKRPNFAPAARASRMPTVALSNYVCFLDAITGGHAHGWAHDPTAPSAGAVLIPV
ncbi:MAG: glycosyltransferase family 2 protein, partial [Gluconacetobacter diazotrophicus]|nr:glycosyltransferase family 2 protein [Gluconacetobacter diazotrophicus]